MLDLFNRQKLRECRSKVYELNKENERLNAENVKLQRTIAGERVCGQHCSECANAYEKRSYYMGQIFPDWSCKLDIKCKDFQKKDD